MVSSSFDGGDEILALIGFGVAFGQIGIWSFWCALGDASRKLRIVTSLLGVVVSWVYLIFVLFRIDHDPMMDWSVSLVLLFQFTLISPVANETAWNSHDTNDKTVDLERQISYNLWWFSFLVFHTVSNWVALCSRDSELPTVVAFCVRLSLNLKLWRGD
ncbi:MAG: hypothetical protein ACI9HK_001453 [Pirellulaceae bacterium]